MTPEQLIEAEAEYQHNRGLHRFKSKWDVLSDDRKQFWRNEALAHFKMLNGCGVRMQVTVDRHGRKFWDYQPLPEAKENE